MFLRSTLFITCRIEFLWAIKRSFKSVHVHWNPLREGLYVGITSMIKANMKSPGKQQKCDVFMTNNSEINGVFFPAQMRTVYFCSLFGKKLLKAIYLDRKYFALMLHLLHASEMVLNFSRVIRSTITCTSRNQYIVKKTTLRETRKLLTWKCV